MTPSRKAPGAEPQPAVLVTARLVGRERSAKLLLIERFSLSGLQTRPEDSLTLPAPDPDRPPVSQTTRIESFFTNVAESRGYWYSDIKGLPPNKEWNTAWKFLENSDLVELRQLLTILFPTLTARTVTGLSRAFKLEDIPEEAAQLTRLIEIAESKAHSLSRGQLRQLKKRAALLKNPLSEWAESLQPSATSTDFDLDPTYFSDLDRYSALTNGEAPAPEHASDVLSDAELGTRLIDGFELRKGQARYAAAVSNALRTGQFLLAEAATGTGKSIGYLLPTIAATYANESRAVIVTRTKPLQGQLFLNDLRKLHKLLPPGFKVALLKGLANYLCLLRYKSFQSDPEIEANPDAVAALMALQIWQEETASGDLSEVELLSRVEAESVTAQVTIDERGCLGQGCPYYKECYAFRARRRAQKSDLVITNYALLLSDLVSGSRILGRFEFAVLDEAHRFEDEATRAFSLQLSPAYMARLLALHAGPKNETLLLELTARKDSEDRISEISDLASDLESVVADLARETAERLRRQHHSQGGRIRFQPGDPVHDYLSRCWDQYEDRFRALRRHINDLLPELSSQTESEQRAESAEARRRLTQLAESIDTLKALAEEDGSRLVMWGIFTASGNPVLTGAPLDVGKLLGERFYPSYRSVVFTSATLDSEDDFEWTSRRLGLHENPDIQVARLKQASPFPLSEQLKVSVAAFLPPPNVNDYPRRLAELLLRLRQSVRVSTLVLCTSHQMIVDLETCLLQQGTFPGELLIQKPDLSVPRLLARFRSTPGATLIGTESFWEGVDLPDDTLRLLVLTRLPFPVPDDPLEQVKSEHAEKLGLSPFMNVSLPTAVLKFRQALGRVIRSASDWGVVLVSDSRMSRKRYGAIFHEAAGVPVDTFEHPSLLCRETADWLHTMAGGGR